MIKAGVRCNDPVFINEHELMYNMKGEVPDEEYFMPLEGSEVTRSPGRRPSGGTAVGCHDLRNADELRGSKAHP